MVRPKQAAEGLRGAAGAGRLVAAADNRPDQQCRLPAHDVV